MTKADDITETRIAVIVKDENDVILVTMKDCGLVDEYDVTDYNLVIRRKSGNTRALKLVIATAQWDMTLKARRVARKEDTVTKTRARAIVVSNGVKASLFNFMKQFNHKGYPQQFFTDRDEAYAWLLAQKEKSPFDSAPGDKQDAR